MAGKVLTNVNCIILIGFMAAGKSKVGRLLAQSLDWDFVDTDREIEKKTGLKIANYFQKYGEDKFRQEEKLVVEELADVKQTVIATGGGLVVDPGNWAKLQALGVLIHLYVPLSTALQRADSSADRPLLAGERENLQRLWQRRQSIYRKADLTVDTSQRDVQAVVRTILNYLEGIS